MNNQNLSKFLNKGIATPVALLIVFLVSAIAGGAILAYQHFQITEKEIETPEEVIKDETADWKTYRNEEYGYEFKYPEEIHTSYIYIHQPTWPPQITVKHIDPNFICEEFQDKKTSTGYGNQKEVKLNNSKYCVLTVCEGTAGSLYVTYKYTTNKNSKQLTLGFVLRFPNCEAYGVGNKMEECQKEQKDFEPTVLIDKMLSTFKFIKIEDQTTDWEIYNNEVLKFGFEKIGFTMKYPESWDYTTKYDPFIFFGLRDIIKDLELGEDVGDKSLGIIIQAFDKATYEKGVLPYKMKSNRYLSTTSSNFEVDGVHGIYYVVDHLVNRLGYQEGDKTVTVDLVLDDGYLSIHLFNYQNLDMFNQMLSSFRFLEEE